MYIMKKLFVPAITLILTLSAAAQNGYQPNGIVQSPALKQYSSEELSQKRWGVGGSFGTSFGQDWLGFQISPQFVYRVLDDLTAGGGMSYGYYRFRRSSEERYTLNYFGMNGSVHYYPVPCVFVFAQPEVWRRWGRIANARTGSEVFPALPLGAGLMIPALDGEMQLSFFYDVIQNNYSPHGNGLGISVGYMYRF